MGSFDIASTGGNNHLASNVNSNELGIQPHTYFNLYLGHSYTSGGRTWNSDDRTMLIDSLKHVQFFGDLSTQGDEPAISIQNTGTSGDDTTKLNYKDKWGQIHTQLRTQLKDDSQGGTYDSAFHIRTAVNGTLATRFAIKEDGMVGIGTTNPTELLEIANTATNDVKIRFLETDISDSYLMLDASADWFGLSNNGSTPDLGVNTASGKVGIGTASPDRTLHIYNSSQAEIKLNTSGASDGGLIYYNDSETQFLMRAQETDGNITFQTGGTTERMRITSAGNVGIGTTSPSGKLDIIGATSVPSLTSADTTVARIAGTSNSTLAIGSSATSPYPIWIQVRHDTADNNTYPLALQPLGGNVGIGTTSPAALMHTYGSSNTAAKFESTDANCNIIITDSGGSGINIKAVGDVATISTGDTMAMTIDASQNVGIGDSSPSYKLEVAGTFYASGSSQAFKKNVTDLAVDSSAIYNLNPVSYNYKKDYENFGYDLAEGKQFGLISEEVAESVPELAIMKDGEPKNVDYQKLSVLLLAEMQKMNKRIKDLECHI